MASEFELVVSAAPGDFRRSGVRCANDSPIPRTLLDRAAAPTCSSGETGEIRMTTGIQSLGRSTTLHSDPIKIGSEDHKRLFCRALLDTFDPYKPALIAWPLLAPDALARLTGLPFWGIAVQTEERATVHIANMAKETSDPLVREALELIAFEENRHRRVLEGLIAHYGIKHEEPEPYTPS